MPKKKIAILGCENSHADAFLKIVRDDPRYGDVEVVGVFSDYPGAAEKLSETYGVKVLPAFDAPLDEVDGVMITARHGARHLPFAKPYIEKKKVLFIDKPITVSEEDAETLVSLLSESGARFTGGSSCKFEDNVLRYRDLVKSAEPGKIHGGFVRAPYQKKNDYGDFYFYAQHLVEILTSVFGVLPDAVQGFERGSVLTVVFRYPDYDVIGEFVDGNYRYSFLLSGADGTELSQLSIGQNCCKKEFAEFYGLLSGEPSPVSPEDFVAPVFVMNAIERSLSGGKPEPVGKP